MNEKKEKYTAVVLAAGKGTRMGGSVAKQFLEIGGKPVVVYALEVFEHSPEIDQIILVTGADKIEYCRKEIIEKYGIKKTVSVCAGGRERYESVWKALQTLKSLESEQDQKPGNAGTSLRMCKRRKSLCPWHAGQGYHQAYR